MMVYMTNELAPVAPDYGNEEMIRTLKETVCKGATDSQFRMFTEVCKRTGLNPFLKEIWFVPGVGVIAGRDGYLRVANEHPMFDGMETMVERDAQGIPVKAICTIWRKDRSHPIKCEAYYNEYRKPSQIWSTYKSAMIMKVAETLALKRAFSINGVVTEEEIGEAKQQESSGEVAQRRIAELSAPKPEAIDVQVIESETPAAEAKKRKVAADLIPVVKAFGELKKDLRKLTGSDARYYSVLQAEGFAKSSELTDVKIARKVYTKVAQELKRAKTAHELMATLTQAENVLGHDDFLRVLGEHGQETTLQVLDMETTALHALLAALKAEVDDRTAAVCEMCGLGSATQGKICDACAAQQDDGLARSERMEAR